MTEEKTTGEQSLKFVLREDGIYETEIRCSLEQCAKFFKGFIYEVLERKGIAAFILLTNDMVKDIMEYQRVEDWNKP